MSKDEAPKVAFESAEKFEAWLEKEHQTSPGLWLKIAKKASGIASVTYGEALDVALCFGWIDGQRKALDDTYFLQRFTPRRPRSIWSQRNREKIAALEAAGRMRPAGLAEVERAKSDGRWDAAYASPSKAEPPQDLLDALEANPEAKQFFAALNSTSRFAIIFRINNVKRAETRARKIATFVEMLANGEAPHLPSK
ncbi:MAG: bacteriocin-protection protein [Corynebacteriales bacterium]|nr:bacteriocin-protection protein [Mycobacteriales bacterium]